MHSVNAARRERVVPLLLLVCLWSTGADGTSVPINVDLQGLLHSTLHGSGGVGVVLDAKSGALLAAERPEAAAQLVSAPGSTLKPFFLASALSQGRINAQSTVVCRRSLRVANRDLACTHPKEINVFNAEQALAYSCNTYFAALATLWTPKEATGLLRSYGFSERPHLFAEESLGTLREPPDRGQEQLLILGLGDVTASPAQLALAYLRLGKKLERLPPVRLGLEGSVAYGMAHNAATPGFIIAGKTGTASDSGQAWTHGWFAGIASRRASKIVIVVYLPVGNGADAASLVQRFFREWSGQTP
jgi:cell division protein FtsI/penicillin-binding protein 2